MNKFNEIVEKAKSICSNNTDELYFDNIHFTIDDNTNGSVVIVGDDNFLLLKYDRFNKKLHQSYEMTATGKPEDNEYSVRTMKYGQSIEAQEDKYEGEEIFFKKAYSILNLAETQK